MPPFTNKELYIMNGGNKQYIGRDGFMDVYNATPAEEAEWAREVVANALHVVDTGINSINIKFAIDNLVFQNYHALEDLLVIKMKDANPVRQIAFANSLWTFFNYPQSFEIIKENFLKHRGECLNEVFWALRDFRKNEAARKFLDGCLAGDDEELVAKAKMSMTMWY
jgi:hypothetical protein